MSKTTTLFDSGISSYAVCFCKNSITRAPLVSASPLCALSAPASASDIARCALCVSMLVRLDLTDPARAAVSPLPPAMPPASRTQSIPPLSVLIADRFIIAPGTGTGALLGAISAVLGALDIGGVAPPAGFTYNQLFTFPSGS